MPIVVTIGIDVGGARKGFHAVALRDGAYAAQLATADVQQLSHWCVHQMQVQVIAIDAPCGWSSNGRARPCERELMQQGIWCFSSPTREAAAALTSIDWIDAALCALAAHHLASGRPCWAYGELDTGLIVVPQGPSAVEPPYWSEQMPDWSDWTA